MENLFFETTEGVRLNYVKGPENGTPVVFIPAQSVTWESYRSVFPHLIPYTQVYTLSIRGHGKSDWTTGDYNFNTIGKDLIEFLEQVVKRPAVLVGNSSGGLISLWLGVNRPDLVLGVVLEDAPLFSADWPRIKKEFVYSVLVKTVHFLNKKDPDYKGLFQAMERPLANGKSKSLPVWMCNLFSHLVKQPNNILVQIFLELFPRKLKQMIKDLPSFDPDFSQAWVDGRIYYGLKHDDALQRIKQPLLILHADWFRSEKGLVGAMDDEDAKRAKELAPHSIYLRLHTGHGIHSEIPKEFSGIILTFIKGLQLN